VANYDILPSMLSYLGLTDQIPSRPRGPGRDFSPLLRGEQIEWEDIVFGEYGAAVRMVRTNQWKYMKRADDGPPQLFDLSADPGETTNLHDSPKHSEIKAKLGRQLDRFFATYSDPLWNMWRPGGTSKHLHTKKRPQPTAESP
jgi:arylsulfatase A-like enzyme